MTVRVRGGLLVAPALLLAACGGGGDAHPAARNSVVPSTRAATAIADAPFTCPGSHDAFVTPGLTRLPPGANAVRICYYDNTLLWLPPAGVLTRSVGALVHQVNTPRVRPVKKDQVCNADLGPAYGLVFRYPDGSRTIAADTAGCRDIVVGSTQRAGGRPLFHAYLAALARQRTHTNPPTGRRHVGPCIPDRIPPFSELIAPALLSDARVCRPAHDGASPYLRHGRRLDATRLRTFRRDLSTARRRAIDPRVGAHYCRAPTIAGPLRITAMDRWGDTFVVDVVCDLYRVQSPSTGGTLTVPLLPATARMLRPLLGG